MAFRAAAVTTSGNNQTSATVTMPSGLTVGDELHVYCTIDNSSLSFGVPSGWTLLDSAPLAAPDGQTIIGWRRTGGANGNEGTQNTWTGLAPPGRINTFVSACWSGRDVTAGPRFVAKT
jgi:hypothetical protein